MKATALTLTMELSGDEFNDLLRSVRHGIARDDCQSAGCERLFACGDVIALEANDERKFQTDLFHGFNDTGSDDVAVHDSAKNVNEDTVHVGVTENDLKSGHHLI